MDSKVCEVLRVVVRLAILLIVIKACCSYPITYYVTTYVPISPPSLVIRPLFTLET